MPRNLLLETGFLCLPDDVFGIDLPDFRDYFAHAIRQEGFEFARVRCWVSQFRIGILVEGLADSQAESVKEIRGPKASAAYDYNNQPSPAAKGFAAAQGLELKDLITREVDGEKFLFAVKAIPGQQLAKNLARLKNALMAAIPFAAPSWRPQSVFPQPPLYFVALLEDMVADLELEGLKAGRVTAERAGLEITNRTIDNIHSYIQLMNQFGLMVELNERKKTLDARIRSVLPEGYRLRSDNQRLHRLCLFSEAMHPVLVKFNPDFLEMPEAVISRFLLMNTDYIPCEDALGKMMPAVVVLSTLEKNAQFEASRRASALNVKFSRLMKIWASDQNTLPARIGRIAEKLQASKGMAVDPVSPLARCAVWLAPRLKINRDSSQIATLLALLSEGEDTELARNLPNTGFAIVTSCLHKFEAFKNLLPVLQEMCSYFAGRIPSPQAQLGQVISLSILLRAHARLSGRLIVSPRRIFSLLKAGNIRIDIFQAFADIFPEFELDRKLWFDQIMDEVLKENQAGLVADSFKSAREFDPCAFHEAAREWKDPAAVDADAWSALYARICSKVERVETRIEEKPCCEIEAEISERLATVENSDGIDYLAIYNFFVKEKVNIEACLMNLPPVLDETSPAQMPRISLLQRLMKQLGRLPFIRKEKSNK